MRKQRVLIGQIAIEGVQSVVVYADLTSHIPRTATAILKDKLAMVLGERFRPSNPSRFIVHRDFEIL